jgi:hypothetical protein
MFRMGCPIDLIHPQIALRIHRFQKGKRTAFLARLFVRNLSRKPGRLLLRRIRPQML